MQNKRYFIQLAYKGSNYHGWQRQPNAITVQQVLSDAISVLLKQQIEPVGAGRTDTGVHARSYMAHFDYQAPLPYPTNMLIYKLNSILPGDIAIHNIKEVPMVLHARFSAISRSYFYVITLKKDVFSSEFSWQIPPTLNIEAMRKATRQLFNHTDFTSFSKLHTDVKTNNCKIIDARWLQANNKLIFYIEADRFLRNMVRAIVGTLVDVGRNKLNINDINKILEAKDRSLAGASAPAQGLFFNNVKYTDNQL